MNKQLDKLKKQLLELSEPVNAFASEAVQLKVIEKALNYLTRLNKQDAEVEFNMPAQIDEVVDAPMPEIIVEAIRETKKPGATKILNQLLTTDYLDTPRTLPEITEHINTNFDSGNFYTYQVSGILLGMVRSNKITRTIGEKKSGYIYIAR